MIDLSSPLIQFIAIGMGIILLKCLDKYYKNIYWFITATTVAAMALTLLMDDDPALNALALIVIGICALSAVTIYPLYSEIKKEKNGIIEICNLTNLPESEVRQRYETIYHTNSQAPVLMRLNATAKYYNVSLSNPKA